MAASMPAMRTRTSASVRGSGGVATSVEAERPRPISGISDPGDMVPKTEVTTLGCSGFAREGVRGTISVIMPDATSMRSNRPKRVTANATRPSPESVTSEPIGYCIKTGRIELVDGPSGDFAPILPHCRRCPNHGKRRSAAEATVLDTTPADDQRSQPVYSCRITGVVSCVADIGESTQIDHAGLLCPHHTVRTVLVCTGRMPDNQARVRNRNETLLPAALRPTQRAQVNPLSRTRAKQGNGEVVGRAVGQIALRDRNAKIVNVSHGSPGSARVSPEFPNLALVRSRLRGDARVTGHGVGLRQRVHGAMMNCMFTHARPGRLRLRPCRRHETRT